jgi:RNA polymerase sigma factor (sigma-70 family)
MFPTTRWSLVASAKETASPGARRALEELCQIYWYPVYAYVRRRGFDRDVASDLTQEFFARLLETNSFSAVDPARGRFRSYVLAACRHFLANEYDRSMAQKRGGGQQLQQLKFNDADRRYDGEPAVEMTAEKLFERRWALTLLETVLHRLRADYESSGKGVAFSLLKNRLTGDSQESYSVLATRLGTTEGAVKVAIHRLRGRYRELLREEIGQTLIESEAIDDEIRDLFAALDS